METPGDLKDLQRSHFYLKLEYVVKMVPWHFLVWRIFVFLFSSAFFRRRIFVQTFSPHAFFVHFRRLPFLTSFVRFCWPLQIFVYNIYVSYFFNYAIFSFIYWFVSTFFGCSFRLSVIGKYVGTYYVFFIRAVICMHFLYGFSTIQYRYYDKVPEKPSRAGRAEFWAQRELRANPKSQVKPRVILSQSPRWAALPRVKSVFKKKNWADSRG